MILILALSLLSVPMLPSPAHAFSCPTSRASNKIDGCVTNSATGNPVSGLTVVIIVCGGFQITVATTTDSNGYFSFQFSMPNGTPCINPNQAYPVSVNGVTPITWVDGCYPLPSPCDVVGVKAYDPTWGQWAGDVRTDNSGFASVLIPLDPAQIENIPAAALYSNTPVASMSYSMSQSSGSGISIGVSLSIGGAAAVQAGFQSSVTATSTNGLTQAPSTAGYLAQPSYVIDYYCAGSTSYQAAGWSCSQGLVTVGPSAPAPQPNGQPSGWNGVSTSEYLNPNSVPDPTKAMDCWYSVAAGQTLPKSFTWTAATTNTLGVSDTLSYRGISLTLSFSFSNTQGTSDTTGVTFGSTNGVTHPFRFYPAGGTCANPTFGSELHVWDMSADFSISSSPSSLGITLGSEQHNTIIVNSLNGFSGTVHLTQSPSAGAVGCWFSGGASSIDVTVPSGGSTSTIPACAGWGPAGSYSDTFTGTSGSLSHSVNVPITVTDFSISAPSVSFPPGSSTSGSVSLMSLQGFSGTVNLGVSAPTGVTVSCPASATVPSWSTATSSCTYSSSTVGTYTVTITGTFYPTNEYYNAPINHSVSITVTVTYGGGGGGGGGCCPRPNAPGTTG